MFSATLPATSEEIGKRGGGKADAHVGYAAPEGKAPGAARFLFVPQWGWLWYTAQRAVDAVGRYRKGLIAMRRAWLPAPGGKD